MKTLTLALLLMIVAIPATAAKHTAAARQQSLHSTLVESIELSAGWRWRDEVTCRRDDTSNSFFVGAGLRLPVARRVDAFADFRRDFTDEPSWASYAGLAFRPFAR